MSITEINLNRSHALKHPACEECGSQTRLTGIEPHPTQPHTDLRTFQCLVCDGVQAECMPSSS